MEQWLELARGPIFRASLIIMIVGVIRIVVLNVSNVIVLIRKSRENNRKVAWKRVFYASMKWIFPLNKGLKQRTIFSLLSMIFHVTIIITPIFLSTHILLWDRGLGISWPAITNGLADYLTLIAIATGIGLFIGRVGKRDARKISRVQDYLLPLLIVVLFATGYLAMHPGINPFDYNTTMFFHVMGGNLIFLLIPFSKISHVALFAGTQLVSELGWHLAPDAGQKVALALGKENEPI